MNAKFKIIFLLAATLPFCLDAVAQQQTTPDEHDQHAQHDQHTQHDQHEHSEHDHHSGHDMSAGNNDTAAHEHKEHSIDAATHQETQTQDHVHEGHSIDAESHEHASEHAGHAGGPTDHGDMHHHHHVDDSHIMDHEGTMIMGQNLDKLPSGCKSVSEEVEITVRAGRKYAERFPGTVFAFDQQQWHVKPCSKVTFHFTNEDNIRHQFMMHGLPKYLYQYGMFHLEVTGPKTVSGTIIVPGSDDTLLVHCDIAQHMEKGMKAQLVIGKGAGHSQHPRIDTLQHQRCL